MVQMSDRIDSLIDAEQVSAYNKPVKKLSSDLYKLYAILLLTFLSSIILFFRRYVFFVLHRPIASSWNPTWYSSDPHVAADKIDQLYTKTHPIAPDSDPYYVFKCVVKLLYFLYKCYRTAPVSKL